MPFFQNPFFDDFEGNWVLGDRQHIPKFVVKGNAGRGKELVAAWAEGPYNLSGNDADGNSRALLRLSFCLYYTKNFATVSVDVTTGAASTSAVTPAEIVTALNADATFASWFTASLEYFQSETSRKVVIRQRKPITEMLFYVISGRAEEALTFNRRAGVGEMPNYFDRHSVANRFTFTDSQGRLIQLNPAGSTVDANLIDNAVDARGVSLGYSSGTVQADYQLLRGRSGIFNFQKITVDGSDRITQIIEYPAGAVAGDMARKIGYAYTAANKNPDKITEIPYVLTSGDLVTP